MLVDPQRRTIRFPYWIREQWLGAEWRRCESSNHVEVKSDRSDISEYFQGTTRGQIGDQVTRKVPRDIDPQLLRAFYDEETSSETSKRTKILQRHKESLVANEKAHKNPKAVETAIVSNAALVTHRIEEVETGVQK